ncbi:MAG: pilus assembly protein [Alphaproteobacteria bacterium]|nr:pilus assembly protein [Alphaproteobacteria bacterium]
MRPCRRGAQAVEVAILLPILLLLFAGSVDLAELMMTRDAMTVATADGARAGSLMSTKQGEDPVATAIDTADQAFAAAERAQTATFTASVVGTKPDAMIVVQGVVTFEPWIGLIPMPSTLSYQNTARLTYQP